MRRQAFPAERSRSMREVQSPTQAYMGKKARPKREQNWKSAAVKQRVRPVGPMKVMGCPAKTE